MQDVCAGFNDAEMRMADIKIGFHSYDAALVNTEVLIGTTPPALLCCELTVSLQARNKPRKDLYERMVQLLPHPATEIIA